MYAWLETDALSNSTFGCPGKRCVQTILKGLNAREGMQFQQEQVDSAQIPFVLKVEQTEPTAEEQADEAELIGRWFLSVPASTTLSRRQGGFSWPGAKAQGWGLRPSQDDKSSSKENTKKNSWLEPGRKATLFQEHLIEKNPKPPTRGTSLETSIFCQSSTPAAGWPVSPETAGAPAWPATAGEAWLWKLEVLWLDDVGRFFWDFQLYG